MKFLVLVKATQDSEAGKYPDESVMIETMKLNEEMVKAGMLLDAGGLWPSSQGKRIRKQGDRREVIDGPFAETKELIGGYWMVEAKSMDEVVTWMKRFPMDGELEIRRMLELGEVEMSDEAKAMHENLEKQARR